MCLYIAIAFYDAAMSTILRDLIDASLIQSVGLVLVLWLCNMIYSTGRLHLDCRCLTGLFYSVLYCVIYRPVFITEIFIRYPFNYRTSLRVKPCIVLGRSFLFRPSILLYMVSSNMLVVLINPEDGCWDESCILSYADVLEMSSVACRKSGIVALSLLSSSSVVI